jgi:hypothetical protein
MSMEGVDMASKKIDELRKRIAERKRSDLLKVLKTAEGRRLFWGLLQEAGVFKTSYAGNALDTAFKEGRRILGLNMLTEILNVDRDAFMKMQGEFATDRLLSDLKLAEIEAEQARTEAVEL